MREIYLGKRKISGDKYSKPYIIAEGGVNHEGSLDKALLMVEQTAEAGLDAIKFQSYKAETLASRNSPAYWDQTKETSSSQFELFQRYDAFGEAEYKILAEKSERCGIDFLSTPFDAQSADYLEPLMPAYKIASADITNFPFLRQIAKKGKPMILSTGASTMSEIYRALETVKTAGNPPVALLHCVLCYPTPVELANLGMIDFMFNHFRESVIGYSDHTPSEHIQEVLPCAWFFGANILEKHFTWNKTLPGNDHYHAMDADDAEKLVDKFRFYMKIMGSFDKTFLEQEKPARLHARRSLVTTENISKGQMIKAENLISKRPAHGISPEFLELVEGSVAVKDLKEDHILKFSDIIIK